MCSCNGLFHLGAYCTVQEHNRMSLKWEFILCEMANRLWENKRVVLSCKMVSLIASSSVVITTIIKIFVIVFCHWQKSVQLIAFNRKQTLNRSTQTTFICGTQVSTSSNSNSLNI